MDILIKGYGSIGKRHVDNILKLGLIPHVITSYPDKTKKNIKWISFKDIKNLKSLNHALICSKTSDHLEDIRMLSKSGIKNFLIEKPIEKDLKNAKEIEKLAKRERLNVYIAYNMRYLKCFDIIKNFIRKNKGHIRIVEAIAGQYLPEWRPAKDYRKSYSAYRFKGGGVDLDLSHEIDYLLYLFGERFLDKKMFRGKISDLEIKSPDILKLVLVYKNFITDITLDYIRRPKERTLRIICDNGKFLKHDFIKGSLEIDGKIILKHDDMKDSYVKMIKDFLRDSKNSKLCTIDESLKVLKVLED